MTRECLLCIADTSIGGHRVARERKRLIEMRGKPGMIVSDNGTEFASRAIPAFAEERGINWHYIDPGKPVQNAGVESFNGRMRDEILRRDQFRYIAHARELIGKWWRHCNEERLHSSLGCILPRICAERLAATGRAA